MLPYFLALLVAVVLLVLGGLLTMTDSLTLGALGTLSYVVGAILLTLVVLVALVAGVRALLFRGRRDVPNHRKRRGFT